MAFVTGVGWAVPGSMGCGRDHPWADPVPGPLPLLKPKTIFRVPCPRFGRMDAFTQYSMAAMTFALRDAGLEAWNQKRSIGIIASSVNGCLDTDLRYYETVIPQKGALASPHLFAYTLASSYLGEAAIHFGLDGPTYVLSERPGDHRMCLKTALLSLSAGECEILLSGTSDLESPVRLHCLGKRISGFLYFVIERTNRSLAPAYGMLGLNPHGDVLFQDTIILDFYMLARACLWTSPQSKETS